MRFVRTGSFFFVLAAFPALASDFSVTQKQQAFSKSTMTLSVGDQLTFHNDDDITHNITVKKNDDDVDDLGLQKPGREVVYRFETKGAYRIVCSIHPRMKMTVTVQ